MPASELLGEIAGRGPALAVVAHPDDESFGLGALLATVIEAGGEVNVLCLTHGEASTLGRCADLGSLRERELRAAADELGVREVTLCDFPDGALSEVRPAAIDEAVCLNLGDARTLIAFEPGGVMGHPDHRAASASALRVAAAQALPVLEWGLSPSVAEELNATFATTFVALAGDDTADVKVDRAVQLLAVACHPSQVDENAVLSRRLELAGETERVRFRRPRVSGESDRFARFRNTEGSTL